MLRYLFQGDSITDANRVDIDEGVGSCLFGYGYPILLASEYLKSHKGKIEFINKGVSGDRIVDLYARIKDDIINLKPDIMSILIGVNDVWHELSVQNGVEAQKFEMIYSMLIEEVKEALPDIKIIILEPFVLNGSGTEMYYDTFREEVQGPRSDSWEERCRACSHIREGLRVHRGCLLFQPPIRGRGTYGSSVPQRYC